jgi:hypothetical protein
MNTISIFRSKLYYRNFEYSTLNVNGFIVIRILGLIV